MSTIEYSISKKTYKEGQGPIVKMMVVSWVMAGVLLFIGPTGRLGHTTIFLILGLLIAMSLLIYYLINKKYQDGMTVHLFNEGLVLNFSSVQKKYSWSDFDHVTTLKKWGKLNAPVKAGYGVTPITTGAARGLQKGMLDAIAKGHGEIFLLRWKNKKMFNPHLKLYTTPDVAREVENFLKSHIKESGVGVIQ